MKISNLLFFLFVVDVVLLEKFTFYKKNKTFMITIFSATNEYQSNVFLTRRERQRERGTVLHVTI